MSDSITHVGFIGLGIMGVPIAEHLLDAGYTLTIYARHPEQARSLVNKGAQLVSSPAKVAAASQVTFTMVGGPADVEEIYLGAEGLLSAAPAGSWLIDLTTSAPLLAKELSEAGAAVDVHVFDCPVTGGQTGAQQGTLTLIAGISEAEATPVRPLLNAFSSKIYWFDKAGQGQLAKLCNQVSLAGAMVGMADALALAEQGGLSTNLMLQMVGSGMGATRALQELGPLAADGDYRPGFRSEHMLKDITLALDQAEELGLTLPGAETARTLYDMLCQIGGANLGTQAIGVLYQEEGAAVAAGLDWDRLDIEGTLEDDEHHGHEHCHHGEGHECHHHHHDKDHECGDSCGCHHHHHEG